MGEHTCRSGIRGRARAPSLQGALGLDDQPAGAEQAIAEHQGDAAKNENGVKQSNELPTKWRPST